MQTSLDHFFKSIDCNRLSPPHTSTCEDPRPFTCKRARERDDSFPDTSDDEIESAISNDGLAPCPTFALQRKLGPPGSGVSALHVAKSTSRYFCWDAAGKSLSFGTRLLGDTLTVPMDDTASSLHNSKCILDFSFDSHNEFVVARQRSSLSLVSTAAVVNPAELPSGSEEPAPILTLSTHAIQRRQPGGSASQLGFSAIEFLGKSLNIVCGLSRSCFVEVFDLEAVDEDVCDPLVTFDISRMNRFGNDNAFLEQRAVSFVTDIAPFSETISLAALTSGESAWFDTRQSLPVLCTRTGNASCSGGLRSICGPTQRSGISPLTAVCFLDDCRHLVTGARDGWVTLWDARKTRVPLARFHNASEICTLRSHSQSLFPGCSAVWANDFAGNVVGLSCGPDGFSRIAGAATRDAGRREDAVHLPPAKLSILHGADLLFLPHLSSNSVMVFNLALQREQESQHNDWFDAEFARIVPRTPTKLPRTQGFQSASALYHSQLSTSAKPTRHDPAKGESGISDFAPALSFPIAAGAEDHLSCCSAINAFGALLVGSSQGRTACLLPEPHDY